MRINSPKSGPNTRYRQALLDRMIALAPARVLEVGCGGGGFLRGTLSLNGNVVGIDPNESAVQALQEEGFDARLGDAEQLEFTDAFMDVVVFSYSAHHIGDWKSALLEALRVARDSVLILDPWFDASIPSQRVALEFDRWCKKIDRECGMVHNDCLTAADLLAPISDRLAELGIVVDYQLELQELGVDRLHEMAREHLQERAPNTTWAGRLEPIIASAQREGISGDGAILVVISQL